MKLLLVSVILLAMSAQTFAKDGGKGGGNPEEGEFAQYARSIYARLSQRPVEAKKIGIDLGAFKRALKNNQVQCAYGKVLEEMQSKNKFAYFVPEDKSIYFICPEWNEKKTLGTPTEILITHEYARAMGIENGNYNVSSNVPNIIDAPTNLNSSTLIATKTFTLAANTAATDIFKTGFEACTLQHDSRAYDRFIQKESSFGILGVKTVQKRRVTAHELIQGISSQVAGGNFIQESDFNSNMTWDQVVQILKDKYYINASPNGNQWPTLTDYQLTIQSWKWPAVYTLQCSLAKDSLAVGDFLDLTAATPSSLLTPQRHFGANNDMASALAPKLHVAVADYGFFIADEKVPGKAVVNIVVVPAGVVKKIVQDDPNGTAEQVMYAYYISLDKQATAAHKGIVIDPNGNTIEEVLQIDN